MMTSIEAAAAYKIAEANAAANPRGTDGHSAAAAAMFAALGALEAAKQAEYDSSRAVASKPTTRSRKASGGRVIHSVGRKSWTEY